MQKGVNSTVKGYVAYFPNGNFGVQIQNPDDVQTFSTFSYPKWTNPFAEVHR